MEIFKIKTPRNSTGFILWKVNNLWQREIKKSLHKYNLTHTQFVVLASTVWFAKNELTVTQVEIATQIEIDKMMTSNVLRTLEKKGLIQRKEHKTDTRAKVIMPTESGFQILKAAVKEVEEFDSQFFRKIQNREVFNVNLNTLLTG